MTDYQHLRIATSDAGVRTITLDRPERLNAVNPRLAEELPAALLEAHRDDAVRVVVLTGAGRGFCAGLDLSDPAGMQPTTRSERLDDLAWVGRWVLAVTACDKPVIAAINGPAAGAGFGLALACDIRVMADSAVVTAGYVRRALSPDAGVSWFLPRLIGLGRASELLLSGRDVRADEAERIGLVTRIMPTNGFSDAVQAYAAELASGPPIAYALTKRVLLGSLEQPLSSHLREELQQIRTTLATADVREAMAAFAAKRLPKFTGQ